MAYVDIAGITVVRRPGMGGPKSEVTQGPQRWERARLNAAAKPDSQAAHLYRQRRRIAARVVRYVGGELEKTDALLRVDTHPGYRMGDDRVKRQYFCSIECIAMDLQLHGRYDEATLCATLHTVARATTGLSANFPTLHGTTKVHRILRAQVKRPVKCRTCHEQIQNDRAQVAAIAKATDAVKQYVLLDGEFVLLSDLRVVDLTDADRDLLAKYSTPVLRHRYVADKGRRFDA